MAEHHPKPGYLPKKGTIPAQLLEAAQRTGKAGLGLGDAEALPIALTRQQLNTRLNRLVAYGLLFKAGKGKVSMGKLRFFAEPADAQAWEKAGCENPPPPPPWPRRQAERGTAALLAERARHNERQAEFRASNRSGSTSSAEMVITERTRRTEAPRPPDHRFQVNGPVQGGLGSLGIGRYAEPASGWVAAAVGGNHA